MPKYDKADIERRMAGAVESQVRHIEADVESATRQKIMAALDLGVDVVKLFPASVVGGPAAIKAFSAPFPGLRFVPTGGVSLAPIVPLKWRARSSTVWSFTPRSTTALILIGVRPAARAKSPIGTCHRPAFARR